MEAKLKPEGCFYDIGANIGGWSLIASHLVGEKGTVYAIEGQAISYATLVANIAINGRNVNVTSLPVYLDHTDRVMHLGFPDQSWLFSGAIVPLPQAKPTEISQSILGWKLDSLRNYFGLKRPTLIRVDADGNELHVLEGARMTLKDDGLKSVMVEMAEESPNRDKAEELLKKSGFAFESQSDAPHKGVFNYVWSRPFKEEEPVA